MRIKTARPLTLFSLSAALSLTAGIAAAQTDVKSMQEIYGGRSSRVADLPPHWDTDNPIELEVLFNLIDPVNSPEADAFLSRYIHFLKSLPDKMTVTVHRVVSPAKYTYATRLRFANWSEYQIYEKSAAFRDYYYKEWKPHIESAEELFTVVDLRATNTK
jgi:hypothetical protein